MPPRTVAHEFVDDVRLGRVQGLGVVPQVLGAEEGPERQAVQEVPARQQAGHRSEGKAGAALQEARNVFLLRHVRPFQ